LERHGRVSFDRFFGIPGSNADTHNALREHPGAIGTDARRTTGNECNVLRIRASFIQPTRLTVRARFCHFLTKARNTWSGIGC
jgi:hypothetical protein